MDVVKWQVGMVVDGKRIKAIRDTRETVWYRPNRHRPAVPNGTQPVRAVTFADGSTASYPLTSAAVASGYLESLPAGNAPSKLANNAERVRANAGRWRGESVHGMSTRAHDMIARTNMFDAGRVNGKVGASRDGVGSARLTGPSFG